MRCDNRKGRRGEEEDDVARGYSLIVHPSKSRRRPIREQVGLKKLRMADEESTKSWKERLTSWEDGMEYVGSVGGKRMLLCHSKYSNVAPNSTET